MPETEQIGFKTLAAGVFARKDVAVIPYEPIPPSADFASFLADDWAARGSSPRATRPTFAIPHGHSPEVVKDVLFLPVTTSTFMVFDATRETETRIQFASLLADPIGTSVVVATGDNQLLLGQRPPNAPKRANQLCVISGYPEVEVDTIRHKLPDVDTQGNFDPFRTVARELTEETGLPQDNLHDLRLTSVIVNNATDQPILTFAAGTHLTSSEILQHTGDGELYVRFIPDTESAVEETAQHFTETQAPTGIATVLYYGRNRFGSRWFEEAQSNLRHENGSTFPINGSV
jgi:8-oxo-dGTP pyrophosphatase MutT (NUDIX family)